jgi:hypothetical protein
MAEATKVLDVSGVRVIVKFPVDVPGVYWFQRLAVLRVSPDRWVMLTPDYDLEVIDLDTLTHHVLGQNTPFSRVQDSYVYAFGPIDHAEIKRYKMLARGYQAFAGDGAIDEEERAEWVVCDPSDDCFGKVVPQDIMDDEDAAVERNGQGVVDWGGELRFVERVVRAQIANYVEARRAAYLEDHSRPVAGDFSGIRIKQLRRVVSELAIEKMAGWPLLGAPAELEVITAVSESAESWAPVHTELPCAASSDSGISPRRNHRRFIDPVGKIVMKDVIRKTSGGNGSASGNAGRGVGGQGGSGRGKGRGAGDRGKRGVGRGRENAAGGAAGGESP